jgi:hypothetical protein
MGLSTNVPVWNSLVCECVNDYLGRASFSAAKCCLDGGDTQYGT